MSGDGRTDQQLFRRGEGGREGEAPAEPWCPHRPRPAQRELRPPIFAIPSEEAAQTSGHQRHGAFLLRTEHRTVDNLLPNSADFHRQWSGHRLFSLEAVQEILDWILERRLNSIDRKL